jgi:hypothetical protein
MRYDGGAWERLDGVIPDQWAYSLDAVFAAPGAGLVIIAAHVEEPGGRAVVVLNHNTNLGRWFGPVTLIPATSGAEDEIRDIDGEGTANLWMVGQRREASASGKKGRLKGWILHLE